MDEVKNTLSIRIAWVDVIIGAAISWVLKKIFDFTYDFTKAKVQAIDTSKMMRKIGLKLFLFSINGITDFEMNDPIIKTTFFNSITKNVFEAHARYHKMEELPNCELCRFINANVKFLKTVFPEDGFYPPYNRRYNALRQ